MPDVRISGDDLEDFDFPQGFLLGRCVTVTMKQTDFESRHDWFPRTYYIGHVEKFDGDEYRHVVINGTGAIHSILLDSIDYLEYNPLDYV